MNPQPPGPSFAARRDENLNKRPSTIVGAAIIAGTIATTLSLSGCGPTPVMQPRTEDPPRPRDAWRRSAVWLYATDGAPSGHEPECQHVQRGLAKETTCKGALCRYPAELISEWLDKCADLVPTDAEKMAEMQGHMQTEANEKPSPCAKELERFLDDGCEPAHCRDDAQEWATRCAQTEGGPLVVSMLAKVVGRSIRSEKPVELDPRSCATLERTVRETAACKTESECKKGLPVLATHQARCTDPNVKASIVRAMLTVSITLGAAREIEDAIPITEEPKRLEPNDLPLLLADGSGAVFSVCHKRVTALDDYLAARDRCDGGFVHLAQARDGGEDRAVEVGEIPLRKTWDVADMFPGFSVVGERERQDAKRMSTLSGALDDAIATTDTTQALSKLVAAVEAHADWFSQNERGRKLLEDRDTKLVRLFEAAARAKVMVGKTSSYDDRRGLVARAAKHPLADISRHGKAVVGSLTRAAWLTPKAWLPQATAAYQLALAPLDKQMKRAPKLDDKAVTKALATATSEARACALAHGNERAAREELRACVFDGCDDGEVHALVETRNDAAARAAQHQRTLFLAVTSVQGEDAPKPVPTVRSIAAKYYCRLPGAAEPAR